MKERTIMTQIASFGSWKSPITSDLIVSETIKFGQVVLDGSDIYWIERRPAENGRYVIVRRKPDGNRTDILPHPYNARTSVHEYGGGSFTVSDGSIYFSNFSDQHVYRLIPGSIPQPIAFTEQMCYADFVIDHRHNRMICVREDHTLSDLEPANTLVSVWQDGSAVALHEMEAEFGVPQWAFGYSTYAFVSSHAIICSFIKYGTAYLGYLDATTGKLDCIGSPYSRIEWVHATPNYAVFICSS